MSQNSQVKGQPRVFGCTLLSQASSRVKRLRSDDPFITLSSSLSLADIQIGLSRPPTINLLCAPKWLLKAWRMQVDPDLSGAA
jgi:hypothetical protein